MNIVYLRPKKVSITTKDLKSCEQLLLWSIRMWALSYMKKQDIKPDLQRAYLKYNIQEAVIELDHFMYCLTFGPKRTVDVNCPLKSSITPDELTLINIFAFYQKGNTSLATHMLNDMCNDKYLIQAKYHALRYTTHLDKKTFMRLSGSQLSHSLFLSDKMTNNISTIAQARS